MFSPFLHGTLRERPRRAVWLPRWGVARYVTLIFRLASVANHHGRVSLRLWRSAGEYPFSFFSTSSTRHPLFPCNSSFHPQISRPGALGVLLRAFPSAVAAAGSLSRSRTTPATLPCHHHPCLARLSVKPPQNHVIIDISASPQV